VGFIVAAVLAQKTPHTPHGLPGHVLFTGVLIGVAGFALLFFDYVAERRHSRQRLLNALDGQRRIGEDQRSEWVSLPQGRDGHTENRFVGHWEAVIERWLGDSNRDDLVPVFRDQPTDTVRESGLSPALTDAVAHLDKVHHGLMAVIKRLQP
jgi:hypothetical protein